MRESLCKYWKLQCLCLSLSLSLSQSLCLFSSLCTFSCSHCCGGLRSKTGLRLWLQLDYEAYEFVRSVFVCMWVCVVPFLSLQASTEDLNDDLLFLRLRLLLPLLNRISQSSSNWQRCADRRHTHSRSYSYSHDSHSPALTLSPQA